jgi:RHS repeat-associated protein
MNPVQSASGVEPGVGLPINPVLGAQVFADEEDLDFVVEGPLALEWQRTYLSTSESVGWFGLGWSSPLEVSLQVVADPVGRSIERVDCVDVFGRRIPFEYVAPGATQVSVDEAATLTRTPEGQYRLDTSDGTTYRFRDREGSVHRLAALTDRNGNSINLAYQGTVGTDETVRVSCSGGQQLELMVRQSRLHEVIELRSTGAAPVVLARYTYTAGGDLREVFNRAGECMRAFEYDDLHRIRHQVYAGSFESWFEYIGTGTESKVSKYLDNIGQSWTFEYRASNTLVTDQSGRTSLYHFDAKRRWIGYTDPLGRLTRFGIDRAGNVRSVVDPAENMTETLFDERNNPVEVRDADGAVTKIEWHPVFDMPVVIIDALGRAQTCEYDARGNLVAEVDPCGAETLYQLDERGMTIGITDAKGGVSTLQYNERGQVLRYTDCSARETKYAYDDNGWLRSVTDELGRRTAYEYDAAGRLRRETMADGSFVHYESDLADRPLSVTDSLGNTMWFQYAPDGLLVRQTDSLGHVLQCRYSPSRQLIELVNENGARYRFGYDAADQLIEESGFDGGLTLYTYDAAGRIVRTIEAPDLPEAITTHYRRDPLGRLLERRTATGRTVLRYDLAGQVVEAFNGKVRVQLQYDAGGRITEEAVSAPGWFHTLQHSYDPLGNRLSTSLPDGTTIGALYYGSEHVHQIRLGEETLADFERDAAHQEVSRTQGRLTTTWNYDAVGRLQQQSTRAAPAGAKNPLLTLGRGSGTEIERHYSYDRAGRLAAAMDRGRPLSYGHDALDRLTRFGDEQFAFDPAHNLQPAGTGAVVIDNRVSTFGPYRYRYDAHGRVVEKRAADAVTYFKWNDDHRLVESSLQDADGLRTTTYLYDPFGRRVAKQGPAGGSWFVWSQETLLRECRDGIDYTFIYEPEGFTPLAQAVARVSGAGFASAPQIYYYHCDQVGLPRELTDAQGQMVWECSYAGWGRLSDERLHVGAAAAGSDMRQPLRTLRLQGQYFDVETGLHYNFNRYYDPDCGRYLSRDPIGLAGGPNEYLFVVDPAGWIDPLGLTGTYIMSGGKKRNYVGKGPKARSQASKRARLKGCQKKALVHKDFGDDDMGFMVEHLLMKHYNARKSTSWANSTRLNSPGKKKYAAASPKRKAEARRKAKALRLKFEAAKKSCGL